MISCATKLPLVSTGTGLPATHTVWPGGIALPRTVTEPLASGMLRSASVLSP
jgi:hypothetical protein